MTGHFATLAASGSLALTALGSASLSISRFGVFRQPPRAAGHLPVAPADALALRLVARRTWSFFEQFVTAEDNMLPPDNFQEDPRPVIAHRTSPTNLGLYLLSVVAAHDLGWLGTLEALERLEATFGSMKKLERYRGHYYNWYDTTDLRALDPRYISSVDSGILPAISSHWVMPAMRCPPARSAIKIGYRGSKTPSRWCAMPQVCRPRSGRRRAPRTQG